MQPGDRLGGQIDDAIESIAELERKALADASLHQRSIERFTRAVGRPRTVFVALGVVAAWVLANVVLGALHHPQPDPPPFYWLETVSGVAALMMTIVILTTQNRGNDVAEQRSRLHLQISMVAERKAGKLIALLEELRYDLPTVPNRSDREAQELLLPTDPHEVAEELEKRTPRADQLDALP